MLLKNGTVLQNRYRIDSLLRHEDMGAIYRATDTTTSSAVAVTEHHILSVRLPAGGDDQEAADESLSSISSTEEVRDRFEKEAQVLADLDHPGVPKLRDYFDIPGHGQYLVMDFIEGHDLEEMLEAGGRTDRSRAIAIGLELCEILDYLHSRTPPVIHRDIKPSNIRITPEGRVVLVGFGVGREQSPGEMTLGAPSISPGYSPLEQYGGDDITDHRSDIYSLGATMVALVSGKAPPQATERALTRSQQAPIESAGANDDAALLKVLTRATALLPRDRYQSVRDLKAALMELVPGAATEAAADAAAAEAPVVEPAAVVVEAAAVVESLPPLPLPEAEPGAAAVPATSGARTNYSAIPDQPRRSVVRLLVYPVGVLGLVMVIVSLMNIMESNRRMETANASLDSAQSVAPGNPATDVWSGTPEGEDSTSVAQAPPFTIPSVDSAEPGRVVVAPAGPPVRASVPERWMMEEAPDQASARPPAGARQTHSLESADAIPPASKGAARADRSGGLPTLNPVRIVAGVNPSAASVELQWTPSEARDFSAYEIYYARQSDDFVVPLFMRSGKAIRNRSTTRISVPGLRCGTNYTFKVRSVDRRGAFRDSEPAQVTTAGCVAPDTLIVSARGDAPYVSIEDALKAAGGGSKNLKRIFLRPGNYVLNGAVTIDRPVTITGIGPRSNVVIEAGGEPCFTLTAPMVAFRGVTIRSSRGRGVLVRGEAVFDDCDLSAQATVVEVLPQGSVTLRGCRVHDSRALGVMLGDNSRGRIDDCSIAGNGAGILVQKKASLAVARSQVLRTREGSGITVQESGYASIIGCDISGNRKSGIALKGGAADIRDCRINKNRWYAIDCSGTGAVTTVACSYAGNRPNDVYPFCDKAPGSLAATRP